MSSVSARARAACLSLFFVLCFAPGTALANGEAFALNGLDNTLSSVELASGASTLNRAVFNGFPNHGVLAGNRLYVAVSGSDEVEVLDAATLAPIHTLSPGAGSNPYAVAVDDAGNVYVSLFVDNEVVRYDAAGVETGRTAVGLSPEGLLLHGGKLYVANTGFRPSDFGYDPGTVSVLDPGDLSLLDTVAVGTNPQWVREHAGRVHVLCTGDFFSVFGEVHVLDAGGAPEDTISLGGSPGFLEMGSEFAFATDYFGGIYRYRPGTGEVLNDAAGPIQFGGSGYSGMALDGLGNLYVALFDDDVIAQVRGTDGVLLNTFAAGDGPTAVVLREEAPVPVRVLAYTAERRGPAAQVRWELADAHLATRITIARQDADGWATVAEAAAEARGEAVDPTPGPAATRYRLTAHLRDGTVEHLAETVLPAGTGLAFALRTNPVRETAVFSLAASNPAPVRVRLFDAAGALVAETLTPASSEVALPVQHLPAGVYYARATQGAASRSVRVVVVR